MNQALSAPHRRSCLRGVSCHWSRPTTGPRAHPRWVSGGLGPAGWAGAHSFIWTIAWSHLDVEEVFEIFRRRQLNAKLSVSGHRPGTAVRARGGAAAQPPPGARSHSLPAALAGTQARRRRVAAPGGAAPLPLQGGGVRCRGPPSPCGSPGRTTATRRRAASAAVRRRSTASRRRSGYATSCRPAAGGRSGRFRLPTRLTGPDGAVLLPVAWRWLVSWDDGPV